jgi:nicotinamidase-related amidase
MPKSALLVMDVQQVIVDRFESEGYLARLRSGIDAARAAGVPVIYVVVGFRPGFPEISDRNKAFSGIRERGGIGGESEATRIHPAVEPQPGETVVTKRRVSAFAGSDLDYILRAAEIDHLVLTGISTSGVVLSTLRQAADLDFGLTVLEDGCIDGDDEVHRVLTEKVFPRQADVTTIDAWAKTLAA